MTRESDTIEAGSTFGCFRGSLKLPPLRQLSEKYNLSRTYRIGNRDKSFLKKVEESKNPSLLKFAVAAEKKIERKLRSKSNLDSLFELCQVTPWRGCNNLWVDQDNEKELIYLDFKNFYPSILCSAKFPKPNKLECYQTKQIPKEPGLVRVRLYIKASCPTQVREIHPFLLQSSLKGCPFYINAPIETLIQTNEAEIWSEYFDLEPIEAITATEAIEHPLKNRVLRDLDQLELLRKSDPHNPKIKELKLFINCATTTPKIGQNKLSPSPFGVHCLSSQIVSNGRAILFDAIHRLLKYRQNSVLQINTDGFLLQCNKEDHHKEENTTKILNSNLVGTLPGQLTIRGRGDGAFLLGPNTWWLTQAKEIVCELGTGRESSLWNSSPVPTQTSYEDSNGIKHTINLLHLADYRHSLNAQTGARSKFHIKKEERQSPLTPFLLIEKEKKRSWRKTAHEFKKFREAIRH